MKKYPTTRVVFDRKHQATKVKKGLIQIEVLFEQKRKFISAGVKVCKNQFTPKTYVCNSFEAVTLNKRIHALKDKIDNYIVGLIEKGEPFSFDGLDRFLTVDNETQKTFPEWLNERILERKDIRDTTRRTHKKLITSVEDFGKLHNFSDLTKANIMEYDDYLRSKGIKQTTIYSYHKLLKTYIHDAMRRDLVHTDPYASIRLNHGESEPGRYLTEEEYAMIRKTAMPNASLSKVRDLFVLQCLTGLSYSDLMDFDFSKLEMASNGKTFLNDKRNKTGVEFCAVFLPEAMAIVNKYEGHLPKFSNQQYNLRLKLVAQYAGVQKDIASHWGRRTCGMLLLNKGVSMEAVSKVLGHSSIRTTETAYAKMLPESVVKEVSEKTEE